MIKEHFASLLIFGITALIIIALTLGTLWNDSPMPGGTQRLTVIMIVSIGCILAAEKEDADGKIILALFGILGTIAGFVLK